MIELILLEKTAEAVSRLYGHEVNISSVGLEKTKKEIEGDFTIVVFPFTKLSRKSPEITAGEIGDYLAKEIPQIREYKIIKGFLNLILQDSFWISILENNTGREDYGFITESEQKPVLVEFSSPNTNKPLHLGHIRNNLLGASVSEILKANGFPVVKLNLVNDRGIHICKSMLAYIKWGNGETPESSGLKGDHLVGKYYVLFDQKNKEEIRKLIENGVAQEEAEKNTRLLAEAKEILRKWESHDPETLNCWNLMNSWVYEGFTETYLNMGIFFDNIQYESQTYMQGKNLVLEGLANGLLFKKEDGSIWADLHEDGLDEKLLLRSDGTSVYMTQDLGTAMMRHDEYDPSKMVYVVGNEQNYHFDVLKIVLRKLGRDWADNIFHLSYGMVELPHGRMKSREGTVVDADDLMDEMYCTAEAMTRELGKVDHFSEEEANELFRMIGMGALKYFILKVDPKKNMLFDPKESIDFNGNTGPFIQYTYARIQSLLRKAEESGRHTEGRRQMADDGSAIPFPASLIPHPASILRPTERNILRLLYQFPSVVKEAGNALSPAVIANFVYDLSKEFNQFYQETPVLKEENELLVRLRLMICAFTGETIRRSMALLGIRVPIRM